MRIYEYGLENPECILLIHPSLVTWDYFENVIPLLEKRYHLLIPALPGYDLNDTSEFSSVEQIASALADELLQKGIRKSGRFTAAPWAGASSFGWRRTES